ncbi:MAG: hypothetical protein P8181_07430 [bacterium]
MSGFDNVQDRSVLDKKPQRIRVRPAPVSGSIETVLRQMGTKEDMLRELAVLNGKTLSDPVKAGVWLKTVGE